MRFKNKVCIVNGGGSGIGRATCERFVAEGGKVVVVDLNERMAMRLPTQSRTQVEKVSSSKLMFQILRKCRRRLRPL
jgi:NAD(P)-dependent dehydrogenase (short-subunit alcohol dehydrogenase family)